MGKWGVTAVWEGQSNMAQPEGRRAGESRPGGASTGLLQGGES